MTWKPTTPSPTRWPAWSTITNWRANCFCPKASRDRCSFCPENFIAGVEMYGGLGDRHSFGLPLTSHYLAPVLAWNLPSDRTLRVSPGFGLNDNSHRLLLRWGISREFSGFSEMFRKPYGGRS